jgi:hypothetical protein
MEACAAARPNTWLGEVGEALDVGHQVVGSGAAQKADWKRADGHRCNH